MITPMDKVDAWHLKRHKKFTASMIYKLLGRTKDGTGFSVGAMTYIEEKAIESMTVLYEKPELEYVESLMHGKTYEEHAYHAYVEATRNYNMRHFGSEQPVFLDYNQYSGGSPDGLMGEGEKIYRGLELKCPASSKNHFKYLKFKDQWDLKECRPEYYAQVQFLLMTTHADAFDWGSYDERFIDKNLRLKIVEVKPDQKFQDNLDVRLQMAHKEKVKIVESLTNGT